MWNPFTAMVWEWWRMTRRQVLFCAGLGTLVAWAIGVRSARNSDPGGMYAAFALLVTVAVLAWSAILARMARKGYPLPLAFSRPVGTPLLVAVPMLYLAFACAATYAVPAAWLRFAYGAALPLGPVVTLLAASSAIFCAAAWFTREGSRRFLASIGFVIALGPALRWLDPWRGPAPGPSPPPLAVDSVALDPAGYVGVALAVAAAYVLTVRGVDAQRHGAGIVPPARAASTAPLGAGAKGMVEHVRDAVLGLVRVRCPTSSPLAAELWLETKARGLPVLAIGIALAACMPALIWLTRALGPLAFAFIGFAAVLPFFAGISVSFWNRESSLRAPMNGFEAVRPATTARLVGVQVAVAVASILGAWALIGTSLWWSAPLFEDFVDFAPSQRALVAMLASWSTLRLVSAAIVGVVGFATVVGLLAAVRAFGVRYGLALWLGVLALVVYAIGITFAVAAEVFDLRIVGLHLWAAAAAVLLATVYAATRAVADRALTPPQAGALAAAWAVFLLALVLGLRGSAALPDLAPPVVALTLSSLVLPLTSAVLAVWAHGLIRHA